MTAVSRAKAAWDTCVRPGTWYGGDSAAVAGLGVLYMYAPEKSWFYPRLPVPRGHGWQCPGCGSLRAHARTVTWACRRGGSLNAWMFVCSRRRRLRAGAVLLRSAPQPILDGADPRARGVGVLLVAGLAFGVCEEISAQPLAWLAP